jgi:hypothetical protein
MTNDTKQPMDQALTLIDQALNLLENHSSTPMTQTNERYDLELDQDTHWGLVKLGAELKMHAESYAEEVLKAHVEHELGKQTSD